MQEMIDTLNNPSMMHAIAVHTPIALSQLGVPLLLLMAFLRRERHTLRSLTLLAYVLLVISAVAAVRTGYDAMDVLPPQQSAEVAALVQKHETLALRVAWFGSVTAVLILITYLPIPRARMIGSGLAIVAGIATATLVGMTGHHGGTLVYKHGAGTPYMQHWGKVPAAVSETDSAAGVSHDAEAAPADDGYEPPIRPIDMGEAASVSFVRDIVPIVEIYCIHCHEGRRPDGNYDMTSHAGILGAGDRFEENIIPGAPDDSPVVQYIRGILQPQMPRGEEPVPEDELHTLRMWIAAGATDDSDGDS